MTSMAHDGPIPDLTLGWRLKLALDHAGMSREQMADELGMHRNTLTSWMNDRGTPPRAIYLRQWALRCGVSYTWLVSGGPESGVTARKLCAA